MLQVLTVPETVVAIRVADRLTGADVDNAIKAVETALEHHDRVSMYAEIEGAFSITLVGLYRDLRYGLSHLHELHRFYRAAVVTDNKWLATVVRVEGLLFAQIEMKVFAPSEREAAWRWVSELPPPLLSQERPIAMREIITDRPNLVAFEIDGHLTAADVERAIEIFALKLEMPGKINVLGRFDNYDGFDFNVFFTQGWLSLKVNAFKKIDRYALVGAPVWMENLVELLQPLVPIEMKCFDVRSEAEARTWLEAHL
jgi:hypothetical protein